MHLHVRYIIKRRIEMHWEFMSDGLLPDKMTNAHIIPELKMQSTMYIYTQCARTACMTNAYHANEYIHGKTDPKNVQTCEPTGQSCS